MATDDIKAAGESRARSHEVAVLEAHGRPHLGWLAGSSSSRVTQQLFGDVDPQDAMTETSKPQGLSALAAPRVEDRELPLTRDEQVRLKLSADELLPNHATDRLHMAAPTRQRRRERGLRRCARRAFYERDPDVWTSGRAPLVDDLR